MPSTLNGIQPVYYDPVEVISLQPGYVLYDQFMSFLYELYFNHYWPYFRPIFITVNILSTRTIRYGNGTCKLWGENERSSI